MLLYLDSANVSDIKECVERGIVSGVTINQSLLAKEPRCEFDRHIMAVIDVLKPETHLSIPFIPGYDYSMFPHDELAVKVPVSWDGLRTIRGLSSKYDVNATCVFSVGQAEMAIRAGASIVSVFVGRMMDANLNGYATIGTIKNKHPTVTVLAGSIRSLDMVQKAETAGADIATVSKIVLEEMANEIHSTQSADRFDEDYRTWTGQ